MKTVKEMVVVVGVFLGLTVLACPWLLKTGMMPDRNDSLHLAYELNQLQINVTEGKPLFWGSYFAPFENTLTFSNPLLVTSVVGGLARYFSSSPLVVFTFGLAAGTVLNGVFSYLLLRRLSGEWWSAMIGAIVFVFAPMRMELLPHVGVSGAWLLPLTLWFLERFLGKKRMTDFVLMAVGVGLECLDEFSMAMMLVLAIVMLTFIRGRFRDLVGRKQIAVSVLIMGGVTAVLWPYFTALAMFGGRSIRDAAHFSIGIDSLVINNWSFWIVVAGFLWIGLKKYFGYGWILMISSAMMLGPVLKVGGNTFKIFHLPIPLPYGLLYYLVPGFSLMRTPTRFGVLVALSAGVIVTISLSRIKTKIHKVLLGIVAVVLVLLANRLPVPSYYFDANIPEVYRQVRELPQGSVILEWPIKLWNSPSNEIESERAIYSLYHQQRRLNGYSSFSPLSWVDLVMRLEKFGFTRENTVVLKSWRVSHVVIDNRVVPLEEMLE